ncbi:MAG TPA: MFS transporter [Verrucomicrobiae bacterium]|jgi:FSR family fosmidomycin resistance protein-like MFS transporter|nr:MFS transporter [Verrucomicrobiae bacterium]
MKPKVESATTPAPIAASARNSAMGILFALSFCHLLNDSIQSLLPAIYPLLKSSFALTFTQIGLITLTFQMVGSVFQPVIGFYTDRNPRPYSLVAGMAITLVGLVALALASSYAAILGAAAMIGMGSAIFHPESSRMARLASGGRHGFAQSLFQVGGNAGSALGPLLAVVVVARYGRRHILWFTLIAVAGMIITARVGAWYRRHLNERRAQTDAHHHPVAASRVPMVLGILLCLIFSKFFYLASMTNYYTFYLIQKFGLSVPQSQIYLFVFQFAVAAGTIAGGPVGDKIGRKLVIWISILGMAPCAILLPHANLFWTAALSIINGMILASAFPAILVYATELLPGKIGTISGLFFGFAFGMAGIASAVLGKLADATSIMFVIKVCSFLPLIGLLTAFLPELKNYEQESVETERSAGSC